MSQPAPSSSSSLTNSGWETPSPFRQKKLGAKTFVHYSFPRHMSQVLLSSRRELMKKKCAELGIEFVDATAPDPTGDSGLPGAQQFILEDVPKMVAKYGKDTAFFSTNCAMQIPAHQGSSRRKGDASSALLPVALPWIPDSSRDQVKHREAGQPGVRHSRDEEDTEGKGLLRQNSRPGPFPSR